MICNLTYLGHFVTLTSPWPEVKFKVDLLRSSDISFDSSRRDKLDGTKSFLLSWKLKKLFAKHFSAENSRLELRWPLEVKPLTLGQIWGHLSERKFHQLSSAFFGFSLAVIVPEIMRVFRSNVWFLQNFGKFWRFWPLETPFLVGTKNDLSISGSSCHALSNAVYRLSLRCVVSEIWRGGGR